MNIVVLAGGYSPEREVSLTSGSLIANALQRKGHRVLFADLLLGIDLPEGKTLPDLFTDSVTYHHEVGTTVPDLEALRASVGGKSYIGAHILEACAAADAVFLALHGDMGENGQVQAMLDNFGIRYTGSGFEGSLLAMDKDLSKLVFRASGVNTPDWICLGSDEAEAAEKIEEEIGYPCVIKPTGCGSSVGISMAQTREELDAALAAAAKYGERILAERKITGREITVAMLDGDVLPMVEIKPKSGFYDYENKYQSGRTEEICPAPIPEEWREVLKEQTELAFACLHLGGYARFDYIVTPSGVPYCLEANTLPGMTPTSLLPQMAAAKGISYDDLCDILIRMALRKNA